MKLNIKLKLELFNVGIDVISPALLGTSSSTGCRRSGSRRAWLRNIIRLKIVLKNLFLAALDLINLSSDIQYVNCKVIDISRLFV